MDRVQQQLNYRQDGDYHIPVVHIAQLIGLAVGVPKNRLAFDAHISGNNKLKDILAKYPE